MEGRVERAELRGQMDVRSTVPREGPPMKAESGKALHHDATKNSGESEWSLFSRREIFREFFRRLAFILLKDLRDGSVTSSDPLVGRWGTLLHSRAIIHEFSC
ncbi:MAG: hypothetical protein ACTSXJ_03620 [Candidatus Baldrarchaeia archaeon]